jgi:hypothetical protein
MGIFAEIKNTIMIIGIVIGIAIGWYLFKPSDKR